MKIVKCPKIWTSLSKQYAKNGKKSINVLNLIEKTKGLEVYALPIYHMSTPSRWLEESSMIDIVGHIKMVLDADLTMPIILDEDGDIMDGRHRLAKALLEGRETILAVRLEENAYDYV